MKACLVSSMNRVPEVLFCLAQKKRISEGDCASCTIDWTHEILREPPTLKRKVQNFSRAVTKWIGAGSPVRTDEEISRLFFTFCETCDYLRDRKCALCGCPVGDANAALLNKIKMSTEHCPIGKWS